MTLLMMCALTLPMCRMAADPDVRAALQQLSDHPDGDRTALAAAMARHPADAARVMALMGSGSPPSDTSLRRRFPREALAFFHLCGQCTATEILSVLTSCTVTPSAEGLALLISERRRTQAMAQYALQLLWRMQGETSLPAPAELFSPGDDRTVHDITCDTIRRLKEVSP